MPMLTMKKPKPKLPLATLHGILVILALLYLFFGPIFSKRGTFFGLFLCEFLFIFLPAVLLRKIYRSEEKTGGEDLNLFFLTVKLILASFPVILIVNTLYLQGISGFVKLTTDNVDILQSSPSLWMNLLFLGIIPAISEELFFRGLIQETYMQYFGRKSIFLSAVIFALFHFDLQNLMAPLLFGLLLGFLYDASHSQKLVIFAHGFYNIINIVFLYYFNGMDEWLHVNRGLENFMEGHPFLFFLLVAALFLSCLYLAILCAKKIHSFQKTVFYQTRRRAEKKDFYPLCILIAIYLIEIF